MATNVIIVIRQQLFYIISVIATLPYQLLPYKVGRIFLRLSLLPFVDLALNYFTHKLIDKNIDKCIVSGF